MPRSLKAPVDINDFAEERLESLLGPTLATETMAASLRVLDLSRLTTPAQLGAFGQLLMDQDDGREIVGALLVLHAARLAIELPRRRLAEIELPADVSDVPVVTDAAA